MSVNVNGPGEWIRQSNAIPSLAGDWTVCFWVRYASVSGYQAAFNIESSGGDMITVGADGSWLLVHSADWTNYYGSAMSVDTWYHIAITREDLATDRSTVYVNGVQDIQQSVTAAPSGNRFVWGNDYYDEWAPVDLYALKNWTAILTVQEILREMRSVLPVRWANIHSFGPVTDIGNLRDWSGRGRDFTASGAATAPDPPVSYGASVIILPFTAAAGGTVGQILAMPFDIRELVNQNLAAP